MEPEKWRPPKDVSTPMVPLQPRVPLAVTGPRLSSTVAPLTETTACPCARLTPTPSTAMEMAPRTAETMALSLRDGGAGGVGPGPSGEGVGINGEGGPGGRRATRACP